MEEKKNGEIINSRPEKVDFYIYDEAMARAERHSRRWMIACVVAFAAFVLSNIAWIIYESQFEDVVTVSQDVTTEDKAPAYVNGTGDMTVNGENKADNN